MNLGHATEKNVFLYVYHSFIKHFSLSFDLRSIMKTNNSSYFIDQEYCHLNLPIEYDFYWMITYILIAFIGLFYAILGK